MAGCWMINWVWNTCVKHKNEIRGHMWRKCIPFTLNSDCYWIVRRQLSFTIFCYCLVLCSCVVTHLCEYYSGIMSTTIISCRASTLYDFAILTFLQLSMPKKELIFEARCYLSKEKMAPNLASFWSNTRPNAHRQCKRPKDFVSTSHSRQ